MNSFDFVFFVEAIPPLIIEGVPVALLLTFLATVTGFGIGLLFAVVNIVQIRNYHTYHSRTEKFLHDIRRCILLVIKRIVLVFTGAVRGTPPVLLLFIVYFGLPQVTKGFGMILDTTKISVKFALVILAVGTAVASNSCEMFRSAYNALDKGQIEAGKSLGYTTLQRFIHIILPQGLRVILPNIGNMIIQEVHNSSLIYYLGVVDIMGKAKQINANVFNAKSLELYVAAALIYWILCFIIGKLVRLSEKSMDKGTGKIGNGVTVA